MRQAITKPATLRKLSTIVGFPVLYAKARGGSNHSVLCCGESGQIWRVFRDGTCEETDMLAERPPPTLPALAPSDNAPSTGA